jgi:hypothetical protein
MSWRVHLQARRYGRKGRRGSERDPFSGFPDTRRWEFGCRKIVRRDVEKQAYRLRYREDRVRYRAKWVGFDGLGILHIHRHGLCELETS